MPISSAVRSVRSLAFLCCLSATSLLAQATSAGLSASPISALRAPVQANRIAANADFTAQTQLANHIPAWVQPAAQVGKTVDLTASMHVSLVLQRDPAVQAAFTQLLEDQQNPASPLYHEWLTPQQVGQLYGPTDADVAALTGWLTSQGLTVDSVAPSKMIVEVSGTGATIGNAFQTTFGYYSFGSATRFSASAEPSIPTALTPLLKAVNGLTESPLMPLSHATTLPMSEFTQSRQAASAATGAASPDYTYTAGSIYFLTPGDFDNIYDITSVISGGNSGATIGSKAQHIAVIGRSRVTPTDVTQFETNTNTALGIVPNVIIPGNGVDPGYPGTTNPNGASAGDQGEATLDVDRTISTAPGATTDLIVSGTPTTGTLSGYDGIYVSASWNVNSVVDPIMTISFGACEISAGSSGVSLWDTLFSSAAAEGISVFVSSGDSGADGCTGSFSPITRTYSASINYICSSSYATCVGGTEFNDASSYSTYWNATNATGLISAIGYIPEGGWNEPTTVSNGVTYYIPASSGGGPSLYIAKPTWQTGLTLTDGARDTPDVAFSAAAHDGYYACLLYAGASCLPGQYFEYFSGTSAAAPSMAAIAALINTKAGKAQGNMSPVLYKAYGSTPTAFHDVTVASSGVTNCVLTTPSMCNNSVPNSSGTTTAPGLAGYSVLTGYDLVTGLGSIDVAKFLAVAAVPTVSTTLALTTVSPNPAAINQTVTLTATLTPSSSTSGAPTGTITFYSNGTAIQSVTIANNVGTITTSFPTAGTYAITATYSGDGTYITSSATAVSLTVNTGPNFSLTPAAATIASFISGSTTGNTDVITLKSINAFTGAVALTCATSGITGATCSVLPTPATLTSGGTATSTLTFNVPAGTSGSLTITVTGTSGTTTNSTIVTVTSVVASSFTLTPGPVLPSTTFASGSAGNTSVVTIASVNNFAGTVNLSCATNTTVVPSSSCSANPATVTLVAGGNATSTITLTTTAGTSGNLVATVTGTGTTTGATVAYTTTATIAATVTAPTFSAAANPTTLTFNSGATTGNTSVITFTSPTTSGYVGTFTTACNIGVSSGSPTYPATCSVSAPSGSLTAGGTATATLTIASTVPHARDGKVAVAMNTWRLGGGALLATLLFFVPIRRRRLFRSLAAFALLAIGLASISGCGGGGTVQTPPQGSAGTYTVTVTGTGATNGYQVTASTTVLVTIN